MQISELLSEETVVVDLKAKDKEEAIANLVGQLAGHPSILNLEAVKKAVMEREKVMSTGVGKGLALPHAKTAAVSATVAALALTREPVDFDAIDGVPVRILFLLVGTPEAKSQHVRILSRISRLMNRDEVREKLLKAKTSEDALVALADSESQLQEN